MEIEGEVELRGWISEERDRREGGPESIRMSQGAQWRWFAVLESF